MKYIKIVFLIVTLFLFTGCVKYTFIDKLEEPELEIDRVKVQIDYDTYDLKNKIISKIYNEIEVNDNSAKIIKGEIVAVDYSVHRYYEKQEYCSLFRYDEDGRRIGCESYSYRNYPKYMYKYYLSANISIVENGKTIFSQSFKEKKTFMNEQKVPSEVYENLADEIAQVFAMHLIPYVISLQVELVEDGLEDLINMDVEYAKKVYEQHGIANYNYGVILEKLHQYDKAKRVYESLENIELKIRGLNRINKITREK